MIEAAGIRMMKLLCDEMLARLARWLRAAGHDAELAPNGADDRVLLAWAIATDRLLVTRDRALADRTGAAGRVLVLQGDGLEAAARELRVRLGLDWLHAPFTRCVVDNTALQPLPDARRHELPERTRGLGGPFTTCPTCGRIYWSGSHHRRMRARLESWQT